MKITQVVVPSLAVTFAVLASSIFCVAGFGQPLRPSNDPYFKTLRNVDTPPESSQTPTATQTALSATKPKPHVTSNTSQSETNNREIFEPGTVVAIVAGQPILIGDMLLEIEQIFDRFMPNAPAEVKNRERPNVIKMLIPKYVDAKLMYVDSIRKLPQTANIEDVLQQAGKEFDSTALPKIMERAGVESVTEYDALLRLKGSSLRQMRDSWAREQLVSYFAMQSLDYDQDVTHEQLLAAYREQIAQYQRTARARWEELMVRFDRFPNRDAAFRAIVEMGNEVVYGAPLDAVAKRGSHGLTASTGGQHDWVTPGSLIHKNLDDAIFALPLNELSEMLETKIGIHIIRVLEREEAHTKPFVEVQSELKEQIVRERREAAIEKYLTKIRQEIPHEIVWEIE
ncbi:MAG: peptidyl-prolyl cis-trans isomerase [Pirellulaceae bacterium]|nr:peptidyl-prolyl cis-trans isomerase [Pirellulaceae bacterium]